MDTKEQKLIEARDVAYCEWNEADSDKDDAGRNWDEAHRNLVEANRNLVEAKRKWVEAHRKLRKYRDSKAQQCGKAEE